MYAFAKKVAHYYFFSFNHFEGGKMAGKFQVGEKMAGEEGRFQLSAIYYPNLGLDFGPGDFISSINFLFQKSAYAYTCLKQNV